MTGNGLNGSPERGVLMSRILRTLSTHTASIASGQTKTGDIDISGAAFVGLVIPSAFSGTTLTFEVSADGTTYQSLYDEFNTQVSMTVATSRSYMLPAALCPWQYMKIVSGSSEGADRSLVIQFKS